MQNNKNNGFQYTYSASEQAEIRKIREKYSADKEEDKMARLLKLDARVTQRAQVVSLIFGVVGALILGFGMSLIMSELGAIFGDYRYLAMPIGVIIGIIGGVIACLAYPMYNLTIKRERAKIAPEILLLTDELMK